MQTLYKYFLILLILPVFFTMSVNGQDKKFVGKEIIENGGQSAITTTPLKNSSDPEPLDEHLKGTPVIPGPQYVLGGTVLWQTEDAASIGAPVKISTDGKVPLISWTLNQQRTSLYSEHSAVPVWEFFTPGFDGSVSVSSDGNIIAVASGQKFYLLNRSSGSIAYELALPDSFYATRIAMTRDGQKVIFAAQAYGGSNTARAYGMDLSGTTPVVAWTFDVASDIAGDWAGISISASGNRAVLTGRYHFYVFNTADGSVVWDHFMDNSEASSGISGDGKVIATANNSGFIQTWLFNSAANEYNLIWQYRVPAGLYSNWASSVGISADGKTILAGSLIFLAAGYDGSIMAFDTYGSGTPKWVYGGVGDLVEDIALSDDGKVAAASTWGDMAHSKPDLLVFDVATGNLTFNVISPGSFNSVDISADGKRVLAGGKGVHAREFGMGGRVYFSEINVGGGAVTGTIDLAGTTNESGVVVKASGTERFAVTDSSGSYSIENITPGTYTITAEKPGYNFGSNAGIVVIEGNTTSNVNFSLNTFPGNAPVLSASTGLINCIALSWSGMFDAERQKRDARITGDDYPIENYDVVSKAADSYKGNILSADGFLADSIAIYRSIIQSGPYDKIKVVSAAATGYTDSTVHPLRNYYYVINKFNETGQTIYSNEAVGTVSDTLMTFDFTVPQSANVPTIDGTISPGEWTDAFKVDISDVFGYSGSAPKPQGSVFMYMKFNQADKMLYVAGEDFLNPVLDNNEGFGFYVDDNNNDKFESTDALPIYQEGNYWVYWHPSGPMVRFRQIFTGGGVGIVDTLEEAPVAFSAASGHLQGEFAIPMDFIDINHIQVYGPDKKIGFGLFLISRDGGVVNYNGWWPQTMNSVFSPQYFGSAKIDVNLSAPPQAPSDIMITRQGGDLLVTWSDPVLGLNNVPLAVPPVINVYKNNVLYNTFAAGVETFLDENVDCEKWYDYQFEAYIVVGQDTLWSPLSSSHGEFACTAPIMTAIKYDDGVWESFYVVDFTFYDNKFALRFTPEFYPARVLRMETLVNGPKPFDYTIQADSLGYPGKVIAGPYRSVFTGSGTLGHAIYTVPGDDPPLLESGDFWVVINYLPESPGAPGVGVDATQPISPRGMYYLSSSGWTAVAFGNLMITAYIADPPPVGVDDNPAAPLTYALEQNYPNPFNPSTIIRYQVPETELVSLEIYNALGQKIRTLVNEIKDAGHYSITWDGKNSSGNSTTSGIYFCKIKAGKFSDVTKMMLLR